jgi:hypothetical protein
MSEKEEEQKELVEEAPFQTESSIKSGPEETITTVPSERKATPKEREKVAPISVSSSSHKVSTPVISSRVAAVDEIFPFKEDDPLNGVFAYLHRKCGGNPHTKGIIAITASSIIANSPEQVIDPEWKSHWVSEDQPDSWIQFDFKGSKLLFTHYTLKTYNYVAGGNHLKSWIVEGSTNEADWLELDRHQSCSDLNDRYRVRSYHIKNPGTFKFIRIRQTWKSHCDSDMLALTAVEFFGTLRMNE